MLFNSHVFLFAFLPITVIVYRLLGRVVSREAGIGWLVVCSALYYGWWDPRYLALLIATVSFNYMFGRGIAAVSSSSMRRAWLAAGVTANLAVLAYFKYADFFVDTVSNLSGIDWAIDHVVLPIGISFFTFQQIAYLVDTSRSGRAETNPIHFALFVGFFPQLIAGPIVHHREMLPQFATPEPRSERDLNLAAGVTIFVLGLAKKVLVADTFARYASPLFRAADAGATTSLMDAWTAAGSYAFQIYFDFSGYSDMAIGAALMCGIRLPINFDSPYRSVNIIEFWRTWHITLSRFLRDYLYFPLGGNRRGRTRRYINLMITMLLGGIWHGAGWNFAFWGGLHGAYLVVNHWWRAIRPEASAGPLGPWIGRAFTFFFVVIAWVPFRAETTQGTLSVWRGLLGLEGFGLDSTFSDSETVPLLVTALAAVWLLPNSQSWLGAGLPAHAKASETSPDVPVLDVRWSPHPGWAVAVIALFVAVVLQLSRPSEFIYYQF